jgi:hypothetical protein
LSNFNFFTAFSLS